MGADGATFVKRRPTAPPGYFAVEAAGLDWLAAAPGGAATVTPLHVGEHELVLPHLREVAPSATAARAFGAALAATHAAGAPWFGCPPPPWRGDGWIGPLPLPHLAADHPAAGSWGASYAEVRVRPFLRAARDCGAVDAAGARSLDAVCDRLAAGDEELTGPPEPPARLHGDLWSGNVLWTASGAVLIDPAASGGHRETDLAMLALFGLPHLDAVLAGYADVSPLAGGWRRRVGVHQLHPLLVHAVLFGAGFGHEAVAVARRY